MHFDPGKVTLTLQCAGAVVRQVQMDCQRPQLTALLQGRPADELVRLVPLVYSLCGQAQGIAARAALAAARGSALAAQVDTAAWAEAAREHAWKLLVDWPARLGLEADQALFVRLMRASVEERPALAETLTQHAMLQELPDAPGEGACAALLAKRIRQRLGELLDWLQQRPGVSGTVAASCLAPGCGEATVETARGQLRHRLLLNGDAVADYEISAPTDRCFAPGGQAQSRLALVQGMTREAAVRAVDLLLMELDPCVPWACCVVDAAAAGA